MKGGCFEEWKTKKHVWIISHYIFPHIHLVLILSVRICNANSHENEMIKIIKWEGVSKLLTGREYFSFSPICCFRSLRNNFNLQNENFVSSFRMKCIVMKHMYNICVTFLFTIMRSIFKIFPSVDWWLNTDCRSCQIHQRHK